MRVAHVISSPAGVGGAERVLEGLLEGGRERGWEQLVLHPFAAAGGTDLARLVSPVPHRPLPCASWTQVPGMRRQLQAELERFRPDVVHSHLFHAGVAIATLPRRRGETRVWSHHHGSLLRDQRRTGAHVLERWAVRRYDVVVAVSEAVAGFVRSCGLPAARVRVVRNGWQGEPRRRDTAARPPTLVCVGNFRCEKDHETLLRAIPLVRSELPDVRLVLLGDGPLRPELVRLAAEAGLGDAVRFEGAVADVWPHLASADVFVLASAVEPLGIAVLEAMAAGLPTVTTDVGGLPEIVDDGRTGLLVSPGDPAALAKAVTALLRDEARRTGMGVAARARASTMRGEDMVASYADIYAGAVAAGPQVGRP